MAKKQTGNKVTFKGIGKRTIYKDEKGDKFVKAHGVWWKRNEQHYQRKINGKLHSLVQ